jgi:hypothetical protein
MSQSRHQGFYKWTLIIKDYYSNGLENQLSNFNYHAFRRNHHHKS